MLLDLLSILGGQIWLLLSHLTDRASFPHPLSRDREAELIARLKAGDAQAKQELIEHNLRLVAHIAKKYARSGFDSDDLVSIGSIGLMKAVDSFKPETGRLSTYASRCIENEILMALRSSKKNRGNVSLFDTIGADRDGNEVRLMDILDSEEESVPDQVERKLDGRRAVAAMTRALDEREQAVLRLRFGLDGSEPLAQREVGKELGISRSYVSRIESRALEKLRVYLRCAE